MISFEKNRVKINGEQALAYGALAAGVQLVAGYPGSPGTGTMNAIVEYARENGHPYVEWSVNERVALEMGIGASMAGNRSLVCTKSVGMNVLLDPLMTLNITGVHAGLVILLGDDPGAYGSQNEQDTRALATMMELPLLAPATPADAYDMVQAAFELSERFNTAIVLYTTRSFSQLEESIEIQRSAMTVEPLGVVRQPYRFVPYPGNAVDMHRGLHTRLDAFEAWAADTSFNLINGTGPKGVIAVGVAYSKLMDITGGRSVPGLRTLKLSTLHPLPQALIERFLDDCQQVMVLEEPDPWIENSLKIIAYDLQAQVQFVGKDSGVLLIGDELLRWQIQAALQDFLPEFKPAQAYLRANEADERPQKENFCAASPNEQVLRLIQETSAELNLDPLLIADPGCWVKVAGSLDGKFAIGSAVAVASGLSKSGVDQRVVALFGDSAFFHSSLPAICNAVANQSAVLMILLDNGGAVSTGAQPTPASGLDALGKQVPRLDIRKIAQACGVTKVHQLSQSGSPERIKQAIRAGLLDQGLFLLILEV